MITTKNYLFASIKKVVKQLFLLQIHLQQKSPTMLTKIINYDNKKGMYLQHFNKTSSKNVRNT